jgi:hypothetical protein
MQRDILFEILKLHIQKQTYPTWWVGHTEIKTLGVHILSISTLLIPLVIC